MANRQNPKQKPRLGSLPNFAHSLSQGLVGFWLFNENGGTRANDISGRQNHGTLVSSPSWNNEALTFDGNAAYVSIPQASSMDFGTGDFTISFWVKTTRTSNYQIMFSNNQTAGTYLSTYIETGTGKLYMYVGGTLNVSTAVLTDGNWNHVVMLRRGGTVYPFVNGIAFASFSAAGSVTPPSGPTIFGKYTGGAYPLLGSLNNARLYNRALSHQEVRTLYENPYTGMSKVQRRMIAVRLNQTPARKLLRGPKQKPPVGAVPNGAHPLSQGMTAWWLFNEGGGSKANDISGRNNRGTLTNGPIWNNQNLAFDGTDDYVNTGKALSNFISASTGSVSIWIKPTGVSPTVTNSWLGQGIITDANISGTTAGYMGIYRGIIGGLDRIWLLNYDANEDKVGIPYTNDQWIHVVWVHSGGNLLAYANGVLVGSIASGDTGGLLSTLAIGAAYNVQGAQGRYFNGSLDDVRVYNRALSHQEVKILYETPYVNTLLLSRRIMLVENAITAQTITGLAKIQNTTTRIITGLARIAKTVLQTITGTSRITKSVSQTESGVGRIQKAVSQTESGLSRIQTTVTQTESGVSRIMQVVNQTIDGLSRITKSVLATVTGIARIQKAVDQLVTGVSRIQKTVTQTITGLSKINITTLRTILGVGNIRAETRQTITGVAHILPKNFMRKGTTILTNKPNKTILRNKPNLTVLNSGMEE